MRGAQELFGIGALLALEAGGKTVGVGGERAASVEIEPLPSRKPPDQAAEAVRLIFSMSILLG